MRSRNRFVTLALPAVLAALMTPLTPLTATTRAGNGAPKSDATRPAPLALLGLHRSEIVALLGDPDKVKRADGGDTLIYKMSTVSDDHLPAADERMVDLPDVGRCVHRVPRPTSGGYEESIDFEPSTVTKDGRMEGGGLSRSQSHSKTIDPDGPRQPKPSGDGQPTGKIRLLLTLDPAGRVAKWSTKGGR